MKIVAITQARCGSSRLPNKIFRKIGKKTVFDTHVSRIAKSKTIDKFIVATSNQVLDNVIAQFCNDQNISCYRGSEDNVLQRFYESASLFSPEYVIRLTSDCPLIDPYLIDEVVKFTIKNKLDYGSNTLVESFPDGQDIEVFTYSALSKAYLNATKKYEFEHVTPYLKENSSFHNKTLFKSANYLSRQDFSKVRLTVDQEEDIEVIEKIVNEIGYDKSWIEYAEYYLNNEQLQSKNNFIIRNEGFLKSLKTENGK